MGECGTPTAYHRHLRAGEQPCEACREAVRIQSAQVRASLGPTGWRGRSEPSPGPRLVSCSPRFSAAIRAYLFDRDHGRCQIPECLYADRRIRSRTGPGKASVDHIIPRSRWRAKDGPDPNCMENLRLAHLRCNAARGNRLGAAQLLMIG